MPVITRSQHAVFKTALKSFTKGCAKHGTDPAFVKAFKDLITYLEHIDAGHTEEDEFYLELWKDKHDVICDDFARYAVDLIINNFGAGTAGAEVLKDEFMIMLLTSDFRPLFQVSHVLTGTSVPSLLKVRTFLWCGMKKKQAPSLPSLEWDPFGLENLD